MRVLLLGNNRLAARVAEYLRAEGDEIAALVLHPEERRRFGEEIVAAAGPAPILDGSRLESPEARAAIAASGAQIGVSVLFGYLLRAPVRELLPQGCVNLHPAYLPWNRGAYPNVWAILDRTPAGVALHWIDDGVDTGDLIARREIPVAPEDTGESLYRRLEDAAFDLFREAWPLVRSGRAPRQPQEKGGSVHRVRDVEAVDEIDLERTYRARDLLDLLRARSFPPHAGAFFRHRGRRIYLELTLRPEDGGADVPPSES
jgi:methionyl-tRNA formyltransferase